MTVSAGLVVCGAGGHGRVVASAARAAGWTRIAFVDRRWPDMTAVGEWPVAGTDDDLPTLLTDRSAIAALGHNGHRLRLLDVLASRGASIATIVHPTAWVCSSVAVDEGCVVLALGAVNHGAILRRGAIVNTGAVVEHDCLVEAGAHISPGAVLAGGVQVGEAAWVGAGATVREGTVVGAGVIVGAGSVVVDDIPPGETWAGVPARPLRRRST